MARDVRMTLAEALKRNGGMDRARVLATTDATIAKQIADDPDTAPEATALGIPLPDPKAIRQKLNLSQDGFAVALGVPAGTIRNWEQGRSPPDPAAVALLRIVERDPDAAFRALGSKLKPKRQRSVKAA